MNNASDVPSPDEQERALCPERDQDTLFHKRRTDRAARDKKGKYEK